MMDTAVTPAPPCRPTSRLVALIALAAATLGVVLSGCGGDDKPATMVGYALQPPTVVKDLSLPDATSGSPFAYQAPAGEVIIAYFGYTNCPDVCPVSLAAAVQALNALTEEEREKVRLIFISVDPERDTLERLKEYTAYFHPGMVGATGTAGEIAALAKAYGAGYVRQPARPDGSYAVDHTTRTYVVAPDGRLADTLELNAPAEKYLATVRGLLK